MLPLLATGEISRSVTRSPLDLTTSSIKASIAGSRSDFSTISDSAAPHSFTNSNTFIAANCPDVPLTGTTLAIVMPVTLSLPTNTVTLKPFSSPGKQ